jgi:chromosome partitioning protein
MEEAVTSSPFPNLDVVPSTLDLAGADIELISMISRESRLKNALSGVDERYAWVFIDCPPALGLLTINVLTAADFALIPIQCEYYALEGISQLLRTIELVRKELNPKLEIARVILTMFDHRTRLSQDVVREVREFFGELVSPTVVPRNVRLSEAPSHGLPVIEYDPRSKGAASYRRLALEVMRFGQERSG